MNPDGTGVTQLTTSLGAQGLDWSPDGSRIAFFSDRDCGGCGQYHIYTIKSDGTDLVQLTNSASPDADPAWSPDGTKLVFDRCYYSQQFCFTNLYVMNSDGTQQIPLTDGTGDENPNLRPYPPVLAANLSLMKTDSPDPVRIGNVLTYTLQVSNNGPDEARGVTLVDSISKQLRLRSVSSSQGSCQPRHRFVGCVFDNIATFGSATVTIKVRPIRSGEVTNTATVSATSPGDPVPGDNSASATTTIQR